MWSKDEKEARLRNVTSAATVYQRAWDSVRVECNATGDDIGIADVGAIQAALADRWALLEFFVLENAVAVFLVTRDSFRVERLPLPQEILREATNQIVEWWNWNGRAGSEPPSNGLMWLYKHLFTPLLPHLTGKGVRGLYLVPHGLLQVIPLHACYRVEKGERVYLGDEFEVVTLPTSALLPKLVPVADWQRASLLSLANPEKNTRNGLPFSEWEAKQIEPLFGSKPFIGREANVDNARRHWERASLLHFTGHGYGGGRLGLVFLAHLRLAAHDAEGREGDILLAHDVTYQMPEMPTGSSVILNGCETGFKDLRAVDEALGLMTAFLLRGASAVLATQWKVLDACAAQLVTTFTRAVKQEHLPLTLALRKAQTCVREMTVQQALDQCAEAKKLTDAGSPDERKVFGQMAVLGSRARDYGEASRWALRAQGDETPSEKSDWFAHWLKTQPPGNPNYDAKAFTHPIYWSAFFLVGRVV
jgi:CHAT domain-containing protein